MIGAKPHTRELAAHCRQVVMAHVHQESKILKESGTNDGLFHIGYDESPAESATKVKVEGEGTQCHHRSLFLYH